MNAIRFIDKTYRTKMKKFIYLNMWKP